MKLQQLMDGSNQSDFILIHDNKDVKGDILLIEFLKQNVKSGINTNLLCLENNPFVIQNLPKAINFNCHFISDHLSWFKKDADSVRSDVDPFKFVQQLQNRTKSHSKMVVIFDSLSLLLLLYPNKCYKEIHNLLNIHNSGSTQCQIICLLHDDVIPSDKRVSLMFERLATTNLYIGQQNKKSQVTIKHRKASGRIIEVTEHIYFDQSLNLLTKEILKPREIHSEDDNKDWMTKDVTFKLGLEDEEKRARSELVLPYLKTNSKESSGEIYYEPDATDDWDEEDPDDDLNI